MGLAGKVAVVTGAAQRLSKVCAKRFLTEGASVAIGDITGDASVAVFLAADDAPSITGQTIYPDGGRPILNYIVPATGQ